MKTSNKLWIIVIATMAIPLFAYLKSPHNNLQLPSFGGQDTEKTRPYETLTVRKTRSETIDLIRGPLAVQYLFNAGAVDDDVAFICHYNGGKDGGGWDYQVPERRLWKIKSLWGGKEWQPTSYNDKLISVSMSLSPKSKRDSAVILYSVTKVK